MSQIQKVVFCNYSDLRLTPGGPGMTGRLATKYITQDTNPNRMYVWNGEYFVQEGQQAAQPVTITGDKTVGSVLTANVNTGWTVSGYQWKRNGANIAGATSATYTQVVADMGATLECAITVSSYVASAYESMIRPQFTLQPVGGVSNVGQTFTLTVAATGSPAPAFQWYRDGSPIAGATSASYTTPATTQSDTYAGYFCLASNTSGVARSVIAGVYANDVPATLAIAAGVPAAGVINIPFAGAVYASGGRGPYTYAVTAGSLPAGLTLGASNGVISGTPSAVTASASVTVRTTDADGSTASTSFPMSVLASQLAPVITTQPSSVTANIGESASFSVSLSGAAPFTYQWRKAGVAIPGAIGATYTITSLLATDAGTYDVVVTNAYGTTDSNDVTLTAVVVAPYFTRQPMHASVAAGETVILNAIAAGSEPVTFQWRKNGTPIAGATNRILTLTNVIADDTGTYSVVATNSAGTATSESAAIVVSGSIIAPPSGVLSLDGQVLALDGLILSLV